MFKPRRSRSASGAASKADRQPGIAANTIARIGRPPKGKPVLSQERMLKEALRILDEQGLDAVSMRALAERLGVTAMSLYRYCDNHESLLDAVYDEILAAHPPRAIAEDQSWREVATEMARALRRAFAAHPKAAMLFAARPVMTPRAAPHVNAALKRLVEAGFGLGIAANLLNVVSAFTIGLGLAEFGQFAATTAQLDNPAERSAASAVAAARELPYLAQLADNDRHRDYDAEFVVGLVAILDGFASRYAKRAR